MRVSLKYASSSKYLNAEDLQGGEIDVEISHVEEDVEMGVPKRHKDVVYFVGMEKGLVLNPTVARYLAQALGDNSDGWGGAHGTLYEEETSMGPGVRIRIRTKVAARSKPAAQGDQHYDEANPPPLMAEELDDIFS